MQEKMGPLRPRPTRSDEPCGGGDVRQRATSEAHLSSSPNGAPPGHFGGPVAGEVWHPAVQFFVPSHSSPNAA
jgi:hypothetical protein